MKRAAMESLLDIRDGVGVAKNLIAGAYMAAQSPGVPINERAALCAVSNVARERLEAVEQMLEILMAQVRTA